MSIQRFLLMAGCALLGACSASRPAAHVIINNESNQELPIELSIIKKHDGSTRHTVTKTLKPGLQEIAFRKFPKGAYAVTVKAHDGLIHTQQPLALDTDRWVMITYMHNDSLTIQKRFGYVDTQNLKKINGKYTGLELYIENRCPPNLVSLK
jgi:hypothetical protein